MLVHLVSLQLIIIDIMFLYPNCSFCPLSCPDSEITFHEVLYETGCLRNGSGLADLVA